MSTYVLSGCEPLSPNTRPAWTRAVGGLNHLHAETRRIEKTILTEFSKIDSADWK
jgi:hypothetical protein